jgi:uncharacterized protein
MTSPSTMRAPADHTITPRDIRFDTQAHHGQNWMGGDPVATAVFNALSLTFPDGERLFMDAVRNYRDQLSGKLLAEARAFIAQEAIHSREHVGLNAGGRGKVPMLGVTIALEHFTAMMADLFLEDPAFWEGVPEDLVRMWQWHAMEESEHKAVAFDVFCEISKDWTPLQRYRVRAQTMVISTILFSSNITRYSAKLLMADGMGPWKAHLSVLNYLFGKPGLFRKSWKAYWDWFRPNFHPWDHDNSAKLDQWRATFAPAAPVAA